MKYKIKTTTPSPFITREMVQARSHTLFIYGDNVIRRGYGGQAKACRGEHNTIGIATKRTPKTDVTAYFSDKNYKRNCQIIKDDIGLIIYIMPRFRHVFVFPNIGEGRAQLKQRAPRTYDFFISEMKNLHRIIGEKLVTK